MTEPTHLHDNVIYLMSEISSLVQSDIEQLFKQEKLKITVEQFSVLAILWYEEGINQQTVANRLNRDKTTITRIVERMVKKVLIVQVPDQLDKRNKRLFLTEKGRSLQQKSIESSGSVYVKALKNIEKTEHKNLIEILTRIYNNLQQTDLNN